MSSQNDEIYLSVYDYVPESWEDAKPFLVEQLSKISNAVNIREIGYYYDEEIETGKSFIPADEMLGSNSSDSQQSRAIFRKVIDFGPLPNAGAKTVPHGITFDSNLTLISLSAGATNPTSLDAIPVPFSSPTLNENIKLHITSTDVRILTGIDYSDYTRCFVTIEYSLEV